MFNIKNNNFLSNYLTLHLQFIICRFMELSRNHETDCSPRNVCASICQPSHKNSALTGRIFSKLYIAEFLKAVLKVLVCLKWDKLSASLFEALTSFLILSLFIIREIGTV